MSEIRKRPLQSIGYQFIQAEYIPEGLDEYHLRNIQNNRSTQYRNLSAYEIEVLVRNNNTADDWNKIHVSEAFNPELVKHCKFFGLVRMGKLEAVSLEHHNLCMPVGLYNSTIISCDFGDNVVVSNVNYMSHYIIGNEVMLVNINELHVTDHAKFGNGIIKVGEKEAVRVWVEVCNENAGRKILPFDGMLAGDAYLWSKFRDDEALMEKFKVFTEQKFDTQRGYYGKISDRCVIKNTSIIKDVWVGTDAYIKGANKLKNLTINSSPEAKSQIGEGCELVNGIIGYGCRIFYGVKAVRFVMASQSQLKYGARLINSYLGDNSTISCCEVLNSLIFPSHEQHHNNSFLCAALVMGQSNIAAGATIGSNHNSRAADGEILTSRGFWPGLCVSLKHNSRFATFTLLAKGDYPAELDIRLPFSLVSNDTSNNRLVVMPAYWFMYNLYALARNAGKYVDRDRRTNKIQALEFDYLAPDTVNEIFDGLQLLCRYTALSVDANLREAGESAQITAGKQLLTHAGTDLKAFTILAPGFENASRPVVLLKVKEAYAIYQELVVYYAVRQFVLRLQQQANSRLEDLRNELAQAGKRKAWMNIGGQLMTEEAVERLKEEIKQGKITNWDGVHHFYRCEGETYGSQKLAHAYACLLELKSLSGFDDLLNAFPSLLAEMTATKKWMVAQIAASRAKDYESPFRQMVYNNEAEMEAVMGKLEDNVFIQQQEEELAALEQWIAERNTVTI